MDKEKVELAIDHALELVADLVDANPQCEELGTKGALLIALQIAQDIHAIRLEIREE